MEEEEAGAAGAGEAAAEEAGAGEAAAEAAPAGQGEAEAGLEEAAVGAAAAVTAEAGHGQALALHPVEAPAALIIPGSNTDQEAAGPVAAAGRPSGEEASSTPR